MGFYWGCVEIFSWVECGGFQDPPYCAQDRLYAINLRHKKRQHTLKYTKLPNIFIFDVRICANMMFINSLTFIYHCHLFSNMETLNMPHMHKITYNFINQIRNDVNIYIQIINIGSSLHSSEKYIQQFNKLTYTTMLVYCPKKSWLVLLLQGKKTKTSDSLQKTPIEGIQIFLDAKDGELKFKNDETHP